MCVPSLLHMTVRRVRKGVVEDVERVVVLVDVEGELVTGAVIDDGDKRRVVASPPQERHVDADAGA